MIVGDYFMICNDANIQTYFVMQMGNWLLDTDPAVYEQSWALVKPI